MRKPQTRRSRRSVQQRWCSRLSSTAEQHPPSSIIYFSYAPFLLSHPLLPHQSFFLLPSHFFFSCFGSIANPLTPTDRSRKSSRRPGDADANAEFRDGDGCYGVEVRGMKGGQVVVVVGWGLERKGGRGPEGERLDTKIQKKQTPILSIQTPPPLLHTSYPIFLTPKQSPHINNTHSPNHPIGFLQKQRLYQPTNRAHKALSTPPPPTISPLLSHPPSYTPSYHPSQNPLFNESKLTETAPSKTIQYTLSLSTIFFTHTIKIS